MSRIKLTFVPALSLVFIITFLVGCAISSDSLKRAEELRCKIPSEKVRVVVEKNTNKPFYSFAVENNHEIEISTLTLGDSFYNQLFINPKFIPLNISGPEGWRALVVYGHENPYMSYYFNVLDNLKGIKPGSVLEGFSIELPNYVDIMEELKFTVLFKDGSCATGDVELAH